MENRRKSADTFGRLNTWRGRASDVPTTIALFVFSRREPISLDVANMHAHVIFLHAVPHRSISVVIIFWHLRESFPSNRSLDSHTNAYGYCIRISLIVGKASVCVCVYLHVYIFIHKKKKINFTTNIYIYIWKNLTDSTRITIQLRRRYIGFRVLLCISIYYTTRTGMFPNSRLFVLCSARARRRQPSLKCECIRKVHSTVWFVIVVVIKRHI